MLKEIGKYITKKLTGTAVGKVAKWGFWGLLFACPGTMIGTVGVTGIVVAGATVHSGIVEYTASKIIEKKIS